MSGTPLPGWFSLDAFHHHVACELLVVLCALRSHVSGPFLVCFFHALFSQVRDTSAMHRQSDKNL